MISTIQEKYINIINEEDIVQRNKKVKIRLIKDYLGFLQTNRIALHKSTIKDINDYLVTLSHLGSGTYNQRVFIIRHFYQWLYHCGVVYTDWGEHLLCKKEAKLLPRNIPLHLMKLLCTPTENELERLKTSVIAQRDQAIVEFLFSTGVRSAELQKAKIGHLSSDYSECFIASVKSGVPRYVYLGRPARKALRKYLLSRGIDLQNQSAMKKADFEQYLFMSQKGNGMSYTSLKEAVRKLALSRIGMAITPHMFRHTFATEMLRATGNVRALQLMLGHRNINSTMCYCHLDVFDRKQTISEYHPMSKASDRFDK